MRLNPPGLEGHWNHDTGEITDLAGSVDFIVVPGQGATFPLPDLSIPLDLADPPLNLFARCRISDVPVSFSTGGAMDWVHFKGQPSTDGLDGNGAVATFWDDLPGPTVENRDAEAATNCEGLGDLIHWEGGMWLSHGIAEPIVPPGRTSGSSRRSSADSYGARASRKSRFLPPNDGRTSALTVKCRRFSGGWRRVSLFARTVVPGVRKVTTNDRTRRPQGRSFLLSGRG